MKLYYDGVGDVARLVADDERAEDLCEPSEVAFDGAVLMVDWDADDRVVDFELLDASRILAPDRLGSHDGVEVPVHVDARGRAVILLGPHPERGAWEPFFDEPGNQLWALVDEARTLHAIAVTKARRILGDALVDAAHALDGAGNTVDAEGTGSTEGPEVLDANGGGAAHASEALARLPEGRS